ncbi:MAG: hypothetical protein QXL96_03145 [Ignisphaera sp.]
MLSNFYLAYTQCKDVIDYMEIDITSVIGLEENVIEKCVPNTLALNSINIVRDIILVPRRVLYVNNDNIDECLASTEKAIIGCIPLDTSSARRLAKIGKVFTVVLTPKNYRYADESQINFMAQSTKPKYVEVHLYPFVSHILSEDLSIDVEKELYLLGNVIEHALRKDVGVVLSAASIELKKTLLATHMDLILYALGFSKRERRLMLEMYPMDLLRRWLNL